MLWGAVALIISLLALSWVQEIMGGILSIFGVDRQSGGAKITNIVVATLLMYCLDFAINTGMSRILVLCVSELMRVRTVQAAIRAFIVDNCPAHQQEVANAWASRVTGVGNIFGFICGYLDLPKILPFLGKTQFQVLCALAAISLSVTLLATCLYIKERDPRLDGPPPSDGLGLVSFFRQVFKSIRHLPPQIARVCEVQLAAWAGWFPFLYYATTYVGQLYVNPIFEDHPNMSDDQIDQTWEDATRVGTSALLAYAIISFVANIVLPIFVIPTSGQVSETTAHHERIVHPEDEDGGETGQSYEPLLDGTPHKVVEEKPTWLSRLQIPGLTLRRTWLLSHLLFAVCMFSTFFISSVPAGSVVIGFVGICWALTLWAPFALISAEVARADVTRRSHRHETGGSGPATESGRAQNTTSGSYAPVSSEDDPEDADDDDAHEHEVENGAPKPLPVSEEENLAQAGIVLGLHNVAVSFPQIFSSLICSAIFKAAQKPRGEPWDDSVGWVLRFGGCAALVAALLTKRLAEGSR
jgi:solute carrier family 45 protein 1/2/4